MNSRWNDWLRENPVCREPQFTEIHPADFSGLSCLFTAGPIVVDGPRSCGKSYFVSNAALLSSRPVVSVGHGIVPRKQVFTDAAKGSSNYQAYGLDIPQSHVWLLDTLFQLMPLSTLPPVVDRSLLSAVWFQGVSASLWRAWLNMLTKTDATLVLLSVDKAVHQQRAAKAGLDWESVERERAAYLDMYARVPDSVNVRLYRVKNFEEQSEIL